MRKPILLLMGALLAAPLIARTQDARVHDFWAACRSGDVAKVRQFLDQGMSPDTRFDAGITPLAAAAMRSQVEVAKLLIERGASLSLREDSIGMTPLGLALFFGSSEIVTFLLAHSKEDMDVVLIFAAFRNQPEWVEGALKRNPSPQDLSRALAVAKAQKNPNADIVAKLENAGAQPPATLSPEQLQRFVGTYANSEHLELEVALRDGKLIGTGGSGFGEFFEQELVALAHNLVFVSSSPTIAFQFDGSGQQFDRAKMLMPGTSFELKRIGGIAQ